MATIRKRKRKDGSVSYTAQIRINQNNAEVYQESRTFSPGKFDNPHRAAKQWAVTREADLHRTKPWESDGHAGLTVGEGMRLYVEEVGSSPGGIGKTKCSCMLLMADEPLICNVTLLKCDSALLMKLLRKRSQEDKAAPATVLQDVIYFRVMMEYARIVWGVPVELQYIDDVRKTAARLGLIGKSEERERRPGLGELGKIMAYYDRDRTHRTPANAQRIPMQRLVPFLIFSTRRVSEVTRIEWDDLDADSQRVLVRDMKHPRSKKGNHRWVHLPDRAWSLLMQQPRTEGEPRIFPYEAKSISTSFQRACAHKDVAIEDLHLHDLRHEGISHYFELGWGIPQVAMVSGHTSWDSLKRYTHLTKPEPVDKYKSWPWLERLGIS
ncbi:MAG: site-specific integrase [Amphritea sp.]|nr:site-specific integrase [Amphritea sp.]